MFFLYELLFHIFIYFKYIIFLCFSNKYLLYFLLIVLFPYIYSYIKIHFKKIFLEETVFIVNHKCITEHNKIIKQLFCNNIVYQENLYYKINIKYFVSSDPVIYLENFYVRNSEMDYQINSYELWKQIKINEIYILRYFKYDTKKIIIDAEECNLQEKYLNKYLLQDISNIIVQYYV